VTTQAALVAGELTIDPLPSSPGEGGGKAITLVWKGRSTDRQPSRAILPYITVWLEKALHDQVPLAMEFDALEHMNSSTITAIVQIVREAKIRGIPLVIKYDESKRWQKLGFAALRVFVTGDGLFELVPSGTAAS
jgi:hypothetical protein